MGDIGSAVGAGFALVVAVSGIHLFIIRLMLKGNSLEMEQRQQRWSNERFVDREVLVEKFDGLSKWMATMQGELAHMRNNLELLLQLRQGEVKE